MKKIFVARRERDIIRYSETSDQKDAFEVSDTEFFRLMKEKYPSVADIQGIPSDKYSCDQIALLFAKQLIKRLKSA